MLILAVVETLPVVAKNLSVQQELNVVRNTETSCLEITMLDQMSTRNYPFGQNHTSLSQ